MGGTETNRYSGYMRFCLWGVLVMVCIGMEHAYPQAEVAVLFEIEQDPAVYDRTMYGEPPQFAIWVENKNSGAIKTVYVTKRMGTGNFEGKTGVPVALPMWISYFRKETGRTDMPTPRKPVDVAVSGPTLKESNIKKQIKLPAGSAWNYYIEVNVAGDFTSEFPSYHEDGSPDPHANGQPSIIYKGEITLTPGCESIPEIIGRTEQMYFSTKLNPDLNGISSAKELFRQIKVSCLRE